MDSLAIFGANLRRLRLARSLSQEEFALRCGLHRTYIGSVERGERNIALLNILAIARALGVPFSELFAGIDPTASEPPG